MKARMAVTSTPPIYFFRYDKNKQKFCLKKFSFLLPNRLEHTLAEQLLQLILISLD